MTTVPPPEAAEVARPAGRKVPGAFTLLELMVAMGVTTVLLTSLLTVSSSVADRWGRATERIDTGVEARVAFEVLTRDLQSAVFVLGEAGGESLHLTYDSGVGGGGSMAGETAWMIFFTPPSDRDLSNPGDICTASYRLAYQDPIGGGGAVSYPIFGLYRSLLDPEKTFGEVLGQPDLQTAYAAEDAGEGRAAVDFLCAHVVGLEMAFWYRDPLTGEMASIPPGEEVRIADEIRSPSLADPVPRAALDSIEVSLSVLSDEGSRLAEIGALPVEELIRRHGSTFTRRIPISINQ